MYRVAICEDEPTLMSDTLYLTRRALAESGVKHEIETFTCAEDLLHALEQDTQAFQLLLLDILMEGMTGMELAQRLRKRDLRMSIVFITSSEAHLKEGYGVQPLNYLLKPVRYEALRDVIFLDRRLNHAPQTITVANGRRSLKFNVRDICYVESMGHVLRIHSDAHGDQELQYALSAIEIQLPDHFCRCHRSFLVNLARVREIGRTEVQLTDGETVPIGRKYYRAFQSAFVRYMNE